MADIEKEEYHLTAPGDREPSDWIDNEAEAIASAKARDEAGPKGWKVERVTYYSNDREVIYPAEDDEG